MSELMNEPAGPGAQEQQPAPCSGRFDSLVNIAKFMNEFPDSTDQKQQSPPCTSCCAALSPCSTDCRQTSVDPAAQVNDTALIQGVLMPVIANLHANYRAHLLAIIGSSLRLSLRCLGQWTRLKWRSLFGDYRI